MTMSNLYHWHDERMNELKLQEIRREVEHAYLLKEAGISGPGLFSRLRRALRAWLQTQSQSRQKPRSGALHPYKTAEDKSA